MNIVIQHDTTVQRWVATGVRNTSKFGSWRFVCLRSGLHNQLNRWAACHGMPHNASRSSMRSIVPAVSLFLTLHTASCDMYADDALRVPVLEGLQVLQGFKHCSAGSIEELQWLKGSNYWPTPLLQFIAGIQIFEVLPLTGFNYGRAWPFGHSEKNEKREIELQPPYVVKVTFRP